MCIFKFNLPFLDLKAELESLSVENKMCRDTVERLEDTVTSYTDDINRLETANIDLKSRVTRAESEAAKVNIENQKLRTVRSYVSFSKSFGLS